MYQELARDYVQLEKSFVHAKCTVYVLQNQLGMVYDQKSPMYMLNVLFMNQELARDGVRLEKSYVHAKCSPSRAALMTGRYAWR